MPLPRLRAAPARSWVLEIFGADLKGEPATVEILVVGGGLLSGSPSRDEGCEVVWCNADGIGDPDVRKLAMAYELVDGARAHPEALGDFGDGQQAIASAVDRSKADIRDATVSCRKVA